MELVRCVLAGDEKDYVRPRDRYFSDHVVAIVCHEIEQLAYNPFHLLGASSA